MTIIKGSYNLTNFFYVEVTINNVLQHKDEATKYRRGLDLSDRQKRRKVQQNKEKAKGSMKLSSFFGPKSSDLSMQEADPLEEDEFPIEEGFSVQDIAAVPVVSEVDQMKKAIESLSLELVPQINRKTKQQIEGTYETIKRSAVYDYLTLRLEGSNKTEASSVAAKRFWFEKATKYRSNMIIKYANEYMEKGTIAESAQGKHSKRVSVLDDNDIKRKVIEWFRSIPRSLRCIPLLQAHLKNVILPESIDRDDLNIELDSNNVATKPLSSECIRRKLIEWGFDFKCLSKYDLICT